MSPFITEETINALAWTVLHSLWQGLLIALIFSLVYYNLKNKSARFKYHLALAAMFAIVISAACTFSFLHDGTIAEEHISYAVPTTVLSSADNHQFALSAHPTNWFDAGIGFLDKHSFYIVGIWIIGLFIFLVKMLTGIYFVNQIRFSAFALKDKSWQQKIDKYLVNLGSSRSVEIAQSALIKMPMMIGFFKPMILFPVGVINGMDAKEVEAIIAHELSHVLRNDYAMNIVQSCIEVLFYFNPAVWWLSSVVRSEREHSCDDMAISLTSSNVLYAKALLNLGYQKHSSNSLVMSFGGKRKKLLIRVQRVLNNSQYKPRVMEKIITSILLLVLIVGISMGANTKDSPAHKNIDTAEFPTSIFVQNEESTEFKEYISIDTLPNKGKSSCQIMYYNDDKRVDIWKENDKVIKLWVDGKRIAEEDFGDYEKYINEVPKMPKPPVPPAAPEEPRYPNGLSSPTSPRAPQAPSVPGRQGPSSLPVAPPAPPAPPAPLAPPGKMNDKDLSVLIKQLEENREALTQEAIELHQQERERIMEELKSLSEITFIDSLHPTLKMVETEDGLSVLKFENGKVFEFENNLAFKDHTTNLEELAEQLAAQTLELNFQMEDIDNELTTLMNESSKKFDAMIIAQEELANLGLHDINAMAFGLDQGAHIQNHHGDKDLNEIVETMLIRDGLITNKSHYSLKLTNDYLKLNGKKMESEIHSRYLKLIQAEGGVSEFQKIKYIRNVKLGKSNSTFEVVDES